MTEEKEATRKPWDKPELIVLTRSKPEEAVLAACKGGTHTGPLNSASNCFEQSGNHCVGCSADTTT